MRSNPILAPSLGIFVFLIWGITGSLPVQAAPKKQIPRFEATSCPFDIPPGETIQCGYLDVPENRSRPDSLLIRLGIAIVKSHSADPAPDPIIFLRGGLGQPTEVFIEKRLSRIAAWLTKRDVVLFDQRGLGWSQPALDCPETHQSLLQERLGANPTIEAQVSARLVCRDRWLAQGIDLTAYNTFETAADVADLWQALGYEQVNLIGASYWTLVAQLAARDHDQAGHIRSLILDSPVPVTVPGAAETPAQVADTLARLFRECKANFVCRTAYPDLETVYLQVIERLQAAPPTLSAINPLDGSPFSFHFTIDDFGFLMQYGSYREFPAMIYDIYDGDFRSFVEAREQFLREAKTRNGGEHFGLRTTLHCNEPWHTISPAQRAAMRVYPEGIFMENPLDVALCKQWPSFTPAKQTLLVGDTPTLVFTAEYDTRLPAAYGDLIISPLRYGYHYPIPGAAHVATTSGGPCPNLMVLSFLDDPTRPPDSRCLATAGPPRFDTQFVIRAAAMRRPVQALLGLMSLLVVGLVAGAGVKWRRFWRPERRPVFTWSHSLRTVGWLPLGVSLILISLAIYAGQIKVLPFNGANALAFVFSIIVAVQAATLFSPEDEPALEVLLATSRPTAWILLERLAVLFVLQGGLAAVLSLFLGALSGEPLGIAVSRWLPPSILLSGIAVYLTLATRRAVLGILVVCLLWIGLTMFGDFIVRRWPIAWPFHLYLPLTEADYRLNRFFITLLGVSLIGLATALLMQNPERLLLSRSQAKRRLSLWPSLPTQSTSIFEIGGVNFQSKFMSLTQLGAMIRYEFLLQWRRTALPALIAGLIITPIIGAFIAQGDFQGYKTAVANGTLAPDIARAEITAAMILVMWLGSVLMAMIMIPLLVADTIPKDRQVGVRELLDSLPLSPGLYLTGKLLSLWLSLLVSLGAAAAISGLVWWLMIGPFEVITFLELWFVGTLLLTLIQAWYESISGCRTAE